MPLSAGNKLGPYEILALIGKGGIRPARFLLIAAFATIACAQTAPFRLGPGITPPRLKKKVEPGYSLSVLRPFDVRENGD
jgi:hypothetical protein